MTMYSKEIGERMRSVREEHGDSQADVAEYCDVSNASICRWENGYREVQTGAVISFCKNYGISADWLLGLETGGSKWNWR